MAGALQDGEAAPALRVIGRLPDAEAAAALVALLPAAPVPTDLARLALARSLAWARAQRTRRAGADAWDLALEAVGWLPVDERRERLDAILAEIPKPLLLVEWLVALAEHDSSLFELALAASRDHPDCTDWGTLVVAAPGQRRKAMVGEALTAIAGIRYPDEVSGHIRKMLPCLDEADRAEAIAIVRAFVRRAYPSFGPALLYFARFIDPGILAEYERLPDEAREYVLSVPPEEVPDPATANERLRRESRAGVATSAAVLALASEEAVLDAWRRRLARPTPPVLTPLIVRLGAVPQCAAVLADLATRP